MWLVKQVCAASWHGLDGAEVIAIVTSSSVSPVSKQVDKHHLIAYAMCAQYFNLALDNHCLFILNNAGSSYMLILLVLAQELGLRINKYKKLFEVLYSEPKVFVGFLDK